MNKEQNINERENVARCPYPVARWALREALPWLSSSHKNIRLEKGAIALAEAMDMPTHQTL